MRRRQRKAGWAEGAGNAAAGGEQSDGESVCGGPGRSPGPVMLRRCHCEGHCPGGPGLTLTLWGCEGAVPC